MFHASPPTLEHRLLCEAVAHVVQRLNGRHGVAQPPLTVPERTILAGLDSVRRGLRPDDAVLAAIEDYRRAVAGGYRLGEHEDGGPRK